MILEWDLDLCTKDMRIVLGATLGGKQLGLPIRVYVTDLHVEGPLRMGFKWMPVAPHLRHMTISFLSVPEVEVKVKPVSSSGLDVTEIPGLQGWIDGLVKQGLQQVRRAGVPYRTVTTRRADPSLAPTDRLTAGDRSRPGDGGAQQHLLGRRGTLPALPLSLPDLRDRRYG